MGMTGSEQESEAPAESGVEDDSVPAPKGHVEFSSAVVVDVPRDTTPNVKVGSFKHKTIHKCTIIQTTCLNVSEQWIVSYIKG